MAELVSKRAEVARDWEDFLFGNMNICLSDPYDEKTNPTGYVNLGTAVNNMCNDIIYPKITSDEIWSCNTSMLQYREGYGIMRLRKALAKVLTELLESHEPVSPDNIFCVTGVASCIDIIANCLADPGDVFLVPTPMYGRIYTSLKQRAEVDVYPIPIITEDNTEDHPVLTLEKIIKAHDSAVAKDHNVRGVLLNNPNNPMGDIYSQELLKDILTFCSKHSLHVIFDEVYALSVYSGSEQFHSILKFPTIPDPQRTHVLYGLSKDFGMAGLRIGAIHTKCEPLQKCLIQLCTLQNIPFPIMDIAARYFEDIEWLKKYTAITQQRLADKFNFCKDYLKNIGLKVRNSPAGFFQWVDFRHLCGSFVEEMDFFKYLFEKAHLNIGPGKEFLCAQPGWFRIVFTESHNHLKEGLSRLEKFTKEYEVLKG